MNNFDVGTFGAEPNSGTNMIGPLRAAFSAAAAAAASLREPPMASVLCLSPGVYDVWDDRGLASFESFLISGFCGEREKYWPPEFHIAFDVRNTTDLVIDGGGATLMMHGFTQPFAFLDCHNLIIRNLTIDWHRPAYSVGTVVASGGTKLRLRLWSAFPWDGPMAIHIMGEYDPNGVCTEREYQALSATATDGEVVIELTKPASVAEGQTIIIRHTTACFWGIDCAGSRGLRMEDITIHATPGVAILVRDCSDMHFVRVDVVPRPHSEHIMSSNHDAIMISGCSGVLEYNDCRFEGMGDDAISTGGTTRYRVLAARGNHVSALFENMDDYHAYPHAIAPVVGNHLELIHVGEGVVQVAEITRVTFDRKGGALEVELDRDVDARLVPGDLIGEEERICDAHISRCLFLPNRSRGIILYRCSRIVVEKCLFYRTGGTGIFFFQGFGGKRIGPVVIRDNTFVECGDGVGYMGAHGVYVEDHWFELPDDIEGGRPYVQNLTIADNTFVGDIGPAVVVKGAIAPRVVGNHFRTTVTDPVVFDNCVDEKSRAGKAVAP